MRKKLRTSVIHFISSAKTLSNDDIEVLEYGFDSLYLMITKLIAIGIITYLLGILREFLLFFVLYGIVRSFSFGVHASKSWICNVISVIICICVPLMCKHIVINDIIKLLMGIISLIVFLIYCPADTALRPIISKKRRLFYKIITLVIGFIYIICSMISNNNFISNALLFAIVVQGVMILPITYFILGQPFNNYKKLEGGMYETIS